MDPITDGEFFKNRVSIDQRPDDVVYGRKELETGKKMRLLVMLIKQAIVSLTERKPGLTLLNKVDHGTKEKTTDTIPRLLNSLPDKVYTITADNGIEYGDHESIAKKLNSKFNFADAYFSWEIGTNENTNGIIRQLFSKEKRL